MSEADDIATLEALHRISDARGSDPQALAAWIAQQPTERHAELHSLAEEIDAVRTALTHAPLPPGLQLRLEQIAAAPPPWHWRDLLNYQLRNWQIAVAGGVVSLMVAVAIWPREPSRPPSLDSAATQLISQSATRHAAEPLALASADRAAVLNLLKGQSLPFDVKLPKMQPGVTLLGGGMTRVGNAAAAVTRWRSGSNTYTLYQFDARAMKLPSGFCSTSLGGDTPAEHVLIWPGVSDQYAWALVGSDGCSDTLFTGEAE